MSTATPMPISGGWRHRAVPAHTRTQVLGLSLLAGSLTVLLAAGLAAGLPMDDAAFLVPMILAPSIGAVLAWRFNTWGRVTGLVLGLGTAVMTFWMGFGLLEPASFIEFTTSTAFVLGAVLSLYGGIAAIVRRKELVTEPARSEVLLDRVALGIVVLALLVSLPMYLAGRTTVDAAATADLPTVTATNFAFADITAPAGGSIVVHNQDPFWHTFTIDELGIDVKLLPGSSATVDLPEAAGSYTFYCIPHSMEGGAGEDDMAATLTLE